MESFGQRFQDVFLGWRGNGGIPVEPGHRAMPKLVNEDRYGNGSGKDEPAGSRRPGRRRYRRLFVREVIHDGPAH